MLPTLRGGEFVLVDAGRQPAVGDIVVVAHPHHGDAIVKRMAPHPDGARGLWLLSDNLVEGTDSRTFGSVDPGSVVGVVTLVLNRPSDSLAS